jgi:hypothetical protein
VEALAVEAFGAGRNPCIQFSKSANSFGHLFFPVSPNAVARRFKSSSSTSILTLRAGVDLGLGIATKKVASNANQRRLQATTDVASNYKGCTTGIALSHYTARAT